MKSMPAGHNPYSFPALPPRPLQATSLPLTTFAQNNGVISLTAVASRQAGWACALWLFLFGIFAKFGGLITSIPDW